MSKTNLFEAIPLTLAEEQIDVLQKFAGGRIERIVSTGQCSPEGFWYDQDEAEWVMVLQGAARLRFAAPDELMELTVGDAVWIDAHRPHRVEWTDPEQTTIWLAVFTGDGGT